MAILPKVGINIWRFLEPRHSILFLDPQSSFNEAFEHFERRTKWANGRIHMIPQGMVTGICVIKPYLLPSCVPKGKWHLVWLQRCSITPQHQVCRLILRRCQIGQPNTPTWSFFSSIAWITGMDEHVFGTYRSIPSTSTDQRTPRYRVIMHFSKQYCLSVALRKKTWWRLWEFPIDSVSRSIFKLKNA